MSFIQRLPVDGTGPILYPDAAMDAGTRALIDMADGWSWGGAIPADGPFPAGSLGPKNYALAEDGWVEDECRAITNFLQIDGGAVRFVDPDDILRLPFGFRHRVDDTHCCLVLWLENLPDPAGVGTSNTLFASVGNGIATNISIGVSYSSAGVVSSARFRTGYTNAVNLPTVMTAALFSGQLHQFGFEFELAADGLTVAYRFYLDGLLVHEATANRNSSMTAPLVTDYAALGMHPVGGSGLNGRAWRAMMQELTIPAARPMAETAALDHRLNRARLAAAAAA